MCGFLCIIEMALESTLTEHVITDWLNRKVNTQIYLGDEILEILNENQIGIQPYLFNYKVYT